MAQSCVLALTVNRTSKGRIMRTLRANGALTVLAVAVVLAALLFGSGTAAQATSTNRTQAVRMAKQYLSVSAFSLKGLVAQLKYEGFSTSDARYGASHAGANWYKQAVRKAKEYLRTQPFSFSGMVEQLEYEGFTHAQAVYGARGAGL
jgi:Host cell surface-exposed lipoprotein